MSGYESSIINLIADNLRDRYTSGFPVIKELVQNADDAKATRIIFGHHVGFAEETTHPLTRGPALWFFNNGGFKLEDCEAIRSFGINSKAGDASTIGKFGLGMKSVFHLGEAFLYLGFTGDGKPVREIINPWDNKRPNHLHCGWNEVPEAAWAALEKEATKLRSAEEESGFFLWLPLRTHTLLDGKGPIIRCFPGEVDSTELGFLEDASLATRLAAVLAMLPHLKEICYSNSEHGFDLKVQMQEGCRRLALGQNDAPFETVCSVTGLPQDLQVAARHVPSVDEEQPFAELRKSPAWPKSLYRNQATGFEEPVDDTSRAEGAVVISHIDGDVGQLTVEWAVFLPLEAHSIRIPIPDTSRHYRITLHGQFFVDAGRKGVVGLDGWFDTAGSPESESALRNGWNRALIEQVVLPMLLPALEHYTRSYSIKDAQVAQLTQGINHWIRQFNAEVAAGNLLSFVCRSGEWVRTLSRRGGVWSLSSPVTKLLPMPKPPTSESGRPWEIFGALEKLGTVIDVDAPAISEKQSQWDESDTLAAIRSIDVKATFSKAGLDYLGKWLAMGQQGRLPFMKAAETQSTLVRIIRAGLQSCGLAKVRRFAMSFSDVLLSLDDRRCIGLGARDTAAASSIPDRVFQDLWTVDSDVLLVPQDLLQRAPAFKPDDADLQKWLQTLQPLLDDPSLGEATMTACRDLLNTLELSKRSTFLARNKDLRIIAARNVRSGKEEPLSWRKMEDLQEQNALFAAGSATARAAGLIKQLAEVLPDQPIFQLTRENRETVFGLASQQLSSGEDASAILKCIFEGKGRIGSLLARQSLVNSISLPAENAEGQDLWSKVRSGMRYLLHGHAATRRCEDDLWLRDSGTSQAWQKLWRVLHNAEEWQILDESIGAVLKHGDLHRLGVKPINKVEVISRLGEIDPSQLKPGLFSSSERTEILCAIDNDPDLWRRLPLHEFADKTLGSIEADVYRRGTAEVPDGLNRGVRIIRDAANPTLKAQQREWVSELSRAKVAELAMNAPAPHEYWQLLLDMVEQGDDDFLRRLGQTLWLPLRNGKAIAPKNIMHVRCLEDELERLASEVDYRFATLQSLAEQIKTQQVPFSRLVERLVPHGIEAFNTILRVLEDLPTHSVGLFPRTAIGDIEKAIPALAKLVQLPAWRMLIEAAAHIGESVWHLMEDHPMRPLDPQTLVKVLNNLAVSSEPAAFHAHLLYLKSLEGHSDFNISHISQLKLRNQRGDWVEASELCAGASGVERQYLLDQDQFNALRDRVQSAATVAAERDAQNPVTAARLDSQLAATPSLLESYFRGWDARTKGTAVGSFLSILGTSLEGLSKHYLGTKTLTHVRQKLCGYTPDQGLWPEGCVCGQALETVKVAVTVVQNAIVEAPNLLGQNQKFPIEKNPELIVVGTPYRAKYPSQNAWIVQFAPADRYGNLNGAELSEVLLRSTSFILQSIHQQKQDHACALWRDLNQSGQLELKIVSRKMLEDLPMYLKQLGAHQYSPIKEALHLLNQARNASCQAEGQSERDKARNTSARRREDLGICLEKDDKAHRVMLQQLRAKLADFQYESDGVLFELFQNADDAVVELGRCEALGGDDIEVPAPARRFVLDVEGRCVRTLHWGRMINYRGPHGLSERWAGFGDDLEKMLILSASDKPADESVTGRFGLGFKSVFLVCDKPCFISGDLQVEIRGGILPVLWRDTAKAVSLLEQETRDPLHRGTLLELPLADGHGTELVHRFARNAGLVTVFARAIRRIELRQDGTSKSFDWSPIIPLNGIEIGESVVSTEPPQLLKLLVIRTPEGSVAIRLAVHGCDLMMGDIVPIWVTIPTRESETIGFVINGPFQIDAGRGQLAGNQSVNQQKMQAIGREVGDRLSLLLEGYDDTLIWNTRREELGLVKECTPAQFWTSVWHTLGKRTLSGAESALQKLVGTFVGSAFGRWFEKGGLIPNGLPGRFAALIPKDSTLRQIPEAWCRESVLEFLWKVTGFTSGSILPISRATADLIRKADIKSRISNYDTESLISVVCPSDQCQPEIATALEGMATALERSEEIFNVTDKISSKIRFQAESGRWVLPHDILCASSLPEHADERMRFDLAPLSNRLHASFSQDAIGFFIRCRGRMQATAETLARWMVDCGEVVRKRASLRYIAEGQLRSEVAALIRKQTNKGWLVEISPRHPLVLEFEETQRREICRALASESTLEEAWSISTIPVVMPTPAMLGADAIRAIHAWWVREGVEHRQPYLDRLYPGGKLDGLSLEDGVVDRSAWMTLFALGAFQRLGRIRTNQTRAFIQYMQRKHWWETICELHPEKHGDAWLKILKDFAEEQNDGQQYDYWLDTFPRLYQLAFWLDKYVDLFEGVRLRSSEQLDPNIFLKPLTDPALQGGGWAAPPINRTMKYGVHLVLRELLRQKIIVNPGAHHQAFLPARRVQELFRAIGLDVENSSAAIWRELVNVLGPKNAEFGGDFDIPLLVLAEDQALLHRICNVELQDDAMHINDFELSSNFDETESLV